jgi:hypothetical protein
MFSIEVPRTGRALPAGTGPAALQGLEQPTGVAAREAGWDEFGDTHADIC